MLGFAYLRMQEETVMNAPTNPRWKNRPEGSTWGDWGPDDQLGRMNLLTPERVVRASKEIQVGERFCLSLPLDLSLIHISEPTRPY